MSYASFYGFLWLTHTAPAVYSLLVDYELSTEGDSKARKDRLFQFIGVS